MASKPQTKALTKAKPKATTTKSNRHNFTQDTVNKLRRRAGNICSNPDCYHQTLEPQITNEEKTTDTGIAAHICAASENGPRYDRAMSEKDRKHISNAVWLCSHCATKIDREAAAYSVALLKQWKKSAEKRIRDNSNKKLYTEDETEYKTNQTLFKSMGLNISERFHYSLTEISKSINKKIRELDPRADVRYSHINGCDHFEINAVESNVDEPLLLKITVCDPKEHQIKLEELFNHGTAVTFDVNEFTTNSDGLNLIFPKNIVQGAITISPTNKKEAIIEIQDLNSNTLISFEDIIYFGNSTFSFHSEKYDGLLGLTIDKASFTSKSQKRETTFTLNFKVWDGFDLQSLKYFDQVHKLYKQLFNSKCFYIKIFFEGQEVFSSKNEVKDEIFQGLYAVLSYTYHCRLLCQILKKNINFKSEIYFSADEHQQVYDAVEEYKDITSNDAFTSSFTVLCHEENISSDVFSSGQISYQKEENLEIDNMFDEHISQNIFVQHVFSKVKAKAICTKQDQLYQYKITLDNADRSGFYKRTTTLTHINLK